MSDKPKAPEPNLSDFKLSEYDNIKISLPEKVPMSETDIDAQLFEYVISGGKKINSIADLDNDWVKQNFEGYNTIEDLRAAIKDDYDREYEFTYSDMKFRACCDALLERLEGEIPEDILAANVEGLREANQARLDAMHITMGQYLKEEHLTPDQYDLKLKDEALYQLRLNVALDLMADALGMQVGNHEITEYLHAPNPEAFLNEIREKDMVEEARRAAVRVKAMRRIVETALVNGEVEPSKHGVAGATAASGASVAPGAYAAKKRNPEEDVFEPDPDMPDFENLPAAEIRDDNPFRLTIIED